MTLAHEIIEEIAEKIAGKYHTPSEGTYDQARDIFRLVVTALRDEFRCWIDADKMFDDILASDGVEAAGGSARKGERADGGDLVLSNTAENFKAPAAAPVCDCFALIHAGRPSPCVYCGKEAAR
jgi:hypothetical protein